MKTIKLLLLTLLVAGVMLAQSDYEKVQNFKNQLAEIQNNIEGADSSSALDSLQAKLDKLKEDYKDDIELLNKSLYPDNYETAVSKVEDAIQLRRKDFSHIEKLAVEVDRLKGEMEILNDKNSHLLAQIKKYEAIGGSPEEVQKLVNELKETLDKRDKLVRDMVDSLLVEFVNHPMTLNDAEKQNIYDKIETGKLFFNIEKTIRDNMDFLRVTTLEPADLGEIKEDQVQFYKLWKKLGPKIAETYSNTKYKSGEVVYITNMFSQWEQSVDEEIWKNVRSVFLQNNIKIDEFKTGDEFVENILKYIQEQIDSFDKQGYDASYNSFIHFSEDIWKDQLRTEWLPILVDNEMLTVDQYEVINTKIEDWENIYSVESSTWWYFVVIIAVVVILIAVFFFQVNAKKKKVKGEEKSSD